MDIVRFKGGLGNQMFQYAFLKSLQSKGREVKASLGFYELYPELMRYELDKVFSNIHMDTERNEEFSQAYKRWSLIKQEAKQKHEFEKNIEDRFFWVEQAEENGNYQEQVYLTKDCIFVGYWQSYRYFEHIRRELLSDFQFHDEEQQLKELRQELQNGSRYVSVHIRRGDYLNAEEVYGGICTNDYYKEAFKYILNFVKNPIFVFFSDDIEWVKQNYKMDNAMYVERKGFSNYQSWYDMSLMSVCSHNIIANSSFSWWGAWLNQKQNHIVIAPKRWVNNIEYKDICPTEWIRLC